MKPSAAILQEAAALHERGEVAAAAARYAEVLAEEPENVDALHLLGVAQCQQARFAEGAALFERALALAPERADLHNLLARVENELGRFDQALQSFDRAVALAPERAEVHFNRANLLAGRGRAADALAGYDRAVAIQPDFAAAWCNRGIALADAGRGEDALASYDRALVLDADFAAAHSNRGNALKALGRLAEAVMSYERALALRPDLAAVHLNRGAALRELGQSDEALASCERALALDPSYAEAHFNRGKVLHDLKRYEEAVAGFERALALKPAFAEAHSARARSLLALGRVAEARADRARAVALDPANHDFAFDLSLIQLLEGNWKEGWTNHERREFKRDPVFKPLSYRRWRGEALAGERLLLLVEQGFGDIIQFCRFVPVLAGRGYRVGLVSDPSIAPLLRALAGIEEVLVPPLRLKPDAAVRWLPLMSVPHVLALTPDTVPAAVPYLAADPERVARWREKLGSHGFRIGIAWQGNPNYPDDDRRSIPLSEFAPLAEIPGVRLISLQKGFGSEQTKSVAFAGRIETFADDFDASGAFLDSAAVMMNLDLAVSSDTAVAHLAGALARPALVALARAPDWRWLLDRDDSPWYPTLRLFRQEEPGDWRNVFRRIAEAVRRLAPRA